MWAFNICYTSSFSIVVEDSKDKGLSKANPIEFSTKTSSCLYITRTSSDFKALDLCTTAIIS